MQDNATIPFERPPVHSSAIGLDIGSHRIRSLRRDGLRLLSRSQRTTYVVLPSGPSIETALRSRGMAYTVCDEGIVVLGDAAAVIPTEFGRPVIGALPEGIVPSDDVLSRQVLALLIEAVLPPGDGTSVCMISSSSQDRDSEEFFAGLVQLRGHRPILMESSIAGGLIALSDKRLTGVSIDLGASQCSVSLLAAGREVRTERLAAGGRWIDDSFFRSSEHTLTDTFGETYRNDELVRLTRESQPESLPRRCREVYGQLAADLTTLVIETFEETAQDRVFRRPTPIAVVGGLRHDATFLGHFAKTLQAADLAAYFSTEFLIADDDLLIPRGLLMAAEIESDAAVRHAA